MRKIIFIIMMIVFIFTGCSSKVDVELVENPSSIQELIKESPVILNGKVVDNPQVLNYKDEIYYLTNVQVKKIYRDEKNIILKNDSILLFQNNLDSIDPLVKKNEDYLLFLTKIDVPGYENVYRTIGLYKGKFKTKDDLFVNDIFKENKKLSINETDLNMLVNEIKYSPKNKINKKSNEEIEQDIIKEKIIEKENK